MQLFFKWYMVSAPIFPESINCTNCGKNIDTEFKVTCPICETQNSVSNIIPKPRPIILWIEKSKWSSDGMTFGIPLSKDIENENFDDNYNQLIEIFHYRLFNSNKKAIPLRAAINQATRVDGTAIIKNGRSIGVIFNETLKSKIDLKLRKWLGFDIDEEGN